MIEKAFYLNEQSLDAITSAGIAMRNVLEHSKGKLFSLSMIKEHEKISWSLMIDRLAPKGLTYFEKWILEAQENTWKKLHSVLSGMAKNNMNKNVKNTAIELITHLDITLSFLAR